MRVLGVIFCIYYLSLQVLWHHSPGADPQQILSWHQHHRPGEKMTSRSLASYFVAAQKNERTSEFTLTSSSRLLLSIFLQHSSLWRDPRCSVCQPSGSYPPSLQLFWSPWFPWRWPSTSSRSTSGWPPSKSTVCLQYLCFCVRRNLGILLDAGNGILLLQKTGNIDFWIYGHLKSNLSVFFSINQKL